MKMDSLCATLNQSAEVFVGSFISHKIVWSGWDFRPDYDTFTFYLLRFNRNILIFTAFHNKLIEKTF